MYVWLSFAGQRSQELRAKVYRKTRPSSAHDRRWGIIPNPLDCLAAVGVIPCALQHEMVLRRHGILKGAGVRKGSGKRFSGSGTTVANYST